MTPVYKVGAVIVRANDREVLIVRTHPKKMGDVPQLVLPRGSRQYRSGSAWIDVRDAATAKKHADVLEPLTRTLYREVEEEAGLSEKTLRMQTVIEMGTRDYASRTKGTYPVHWFIVAADEKAVAEIDAANPPDALELRWVSLATLKELAASAEFAAGYIPVVEEALVLVGA